MSAPDLDALIARIKVAEKEQEAELLTEAFYAVFPEPPRDYSYRGKMSLKAALAHPDHKQVLERYHEWRREVRGPFLRLLFAGGFLDAALRLVPEGWGYQVMPLFCVLRHPERTFFNTSKDVEAHGKTPALALTAAALKARAAA